MTAPMFITDERNEAMRALEKSVQELQDVPVDPYSWKWVLIALHNAVQGYMVVILRGTNDAMIARAKSAALEAFNQGDSMALVNADLQGFMELFRRIQDENYICRIGANKPFVPTAEVVDDIDLLLHHRNTFIHFMPRTLLIDLSHIDFPRIVWSVATIISYIQGCGGIYWFEDEFDQQTTNLLHALRQEARLVAAHYGASLPAE